MQCTIWFRALHEIFRLLALCAATSPPEKSLPRLPRQNKRKGSSEEFTSPTSRGASKLTICFSRRAEAVAASTLRQTAKTCSATCGSAILKCPHYLKCIIVAEMRSRFTSSIDACFWKTGFSIDHALAVMYFCRFFASTTGQGWGRVA